MEVQTMTIEEALAKHELTKETVSHNIKVNLKRLDKLNEAIAEAKEKLKTAPTPKKKVDLEAEITTGEENIVAITNNIVEAIEKFGNNKEVNAARALNLEKVRKEKAEKKQQGQQQQQKPPASTTPPKAATPAQPAAPAVPDTPATPVEVVEVVEEPVKKKSSAVGWIVGGILAAVGLGALAYHFKNRE